MNPWAHSGLVRPEHQWRLVAYRWTLPLLILVLVYYATLNWGSVTGWFNAAFALGAALLWLVALHRPAQSVLFTDCAITAIIWTGIAKSIALLFLTDGQEALVSFRQLLFWTPVVTVFWALAFSGSLWVVSVLVFALVSVFLGADQLLLQKLGAGLFQEMLIPTLLQGLIAFSLVSIFAHTALRMKPSEDDRRRVANEVMTDELTDLPSRTAFEADLARQAKIARHSLAPLAIALIRVEALSRINHELGEDAGDEVIIESAKVLRNAFSEADLVARWNVNTFAVVMPHLELDAARVIVDAACRETSARVSKLHGALALAAGVTGVSPNETADAAMLRLSSTTNRTY